MANPRPTPKPMIFGPPWPPGTRGNPAGYSRGRRISDAIDITLAPKKHIRTRRASEGSASEPSLARWVSMCKDAKLSCRRNNAGHSQHEGFRTRPRADPGGLVGSVTRWASRGVRVGFRFCQVAATQGGSSRRRRPTASPSRFSRRSKAALPHFPTGLPS